MFQPVSSKVSFPQMEETILRFWKENSIFERSVEARQGKERFTLYEGPPTANGNPGIHHVLTRVFKDVMPRYKTMKGYYAPRRAGWDTHGLPVELEVEKELGLHSKAQIEDYGIAKFNARCRESVFRYLKEWKALTERIGFWVDLEHPYITLENSYIESCWWLLKQLWDKGLVYQGFKVTPHCPRCGTSLSSHEVALGYKDDAEDPSVYIKFRLDLSTPGGSDEARQALYSEVPTYFLAWTTTPWTLPGNTALAVAPDADYALVEYNADAGGKERLILAEALLGAVLRHEYIVAGKLKGRELVGFHYQPLFDPSEYGVPFSQLSADKYHDLFGGPSTQFQTRVIAGEFVSLVDGTGIVHIAPAFGEVDYEVGKKEGLCLVRDYVQPDGKIAGNYPFSGSFVKDADPHIVGLLKTRGLLYRSERIRHTYPFCWRCDTPLLYYAKQSWYIRTTAKKDRLVANNEQINWYPEYIKHGRFGDWLGNNVDWAFSRERYWGTPLPLWRCQGCGYIECIGSVDDLRKLAHHDAMAEAGYSLDDCLKDLHRPFIDNVILKCPHYGPEVSHYPDKMRRLPEVVDCWFDSGAMPVAQWHHPFEHQAEFKTTFPADFICEAVDQTRGWFYSLHAISTLIFDRPCFKNVICLGHVLDAEGEKMSKAKGNVIEPKVVLNKFGADALRWYLLTSSPPGNVRRFATEQVEELVRQFLLTLWNTYSFFITYANIDRYHPDSPPGERSELDRWLLSELNQLIAEVTQALESYNPTEAGRKIEVFVDNLSNWYIRRSRRRFWKSENDADKLAAYATLYHCLVTLSKLLAPLAPFVAEELYQNLVRSVYPQVPQSVHLTDFPVADKSLIDEKLGADVRLAMKVSSLGRACRAKAGIKVRQPLSQLLVRARSEGEKEALRRVASQLLEELNVKGLDFVSDKITVETPGYSAIEDNEHLVAVCTKLSDELLAEGKAREIVHRLQTMRRRAGFDIADYIETYYQGGAPLSEVMKSFADYIKQETLSRQLVEDKIPPDAYTEKHRLDGQELVLAVKKLTS